MEKAANPLRECSLCSFPAVLRRLFTQAESFDDRTIAGDVACLQVIEQGTTLTNQTCESTLGAVVLTVLLHVLGEMGNAVSEQSDLALGTTCVLFTLTELLKDLFFLS